MWSALSRQYRYETRPFFGIVRTARASIASTRGDLAPFVSLARQAVAVLYDTDVLIYGGALMLAADAYMLDGDVGEASEQQITEALRRVRSNNNRLATLHGILSMARFYKLKGRLRQTFTVYQQALEIGPGEALQQVLLSNSAYQFGLGDLFYKWGELEAAEQHLTRAAAQIHAPMVTDAEMTMQGYIALARLKQAQGDHNGALAALDACEQIGRDRRFVPPLLAQLAAVRAWLAVMQGDLEVAWRWVEASGLHPDDEISFPREAEYLTLARVLIQQRHEAQALGLLERMRQAAEAGARIQSVLHILVLQSLAHQAQDDLPGALTPLARALMLAAPEGYVRLFADEGLAMRDLLRQAAARMPQFAENITTLLAAFPGQAEPSPASVPPTAPASSPLIETLNERELEVLRLIAQGHSNREIAERIVIALSTVKTHINNCYG